MTVCCEIPPSLQALREGDLNEACTVATDVEYAFSIAFFSCENSLAIVDAQPAQQTEPSSDDPAANLCTHDCLRVGAHLRSTWDRYVTSEVSAMDVCVALTQYSSTSSMQSSFASVREEGGGAAGPSPSPPDHPAATPIRWETCPLPLPILKVIAQAVVEQHRCDKASSGAAFLYDGREARPAMRALRLAIRCPLNHRGLLMGPIRVVDVLVERCADDPDAAAALQTFLAAAMGGASAMSQRRGGTSRGVSNSLSPERSPSPGRSKSPGHDIHRVASCGIAQSIWRWRITEQEASSALGVPTLHDKGDSSLYQALTYTLLPRCLHNGRARTLSDMARNVVHRLVQLVLWYGPARPLSLHLPHEDNHLLHDGEDGVATDLMPCIAHYVVDLCHHSSHHMVHGTTTLLDDICSLLSRYGCVMETCPQWFNPSLRKVAVAGVGGDGPSSTSLEREVVVVPMLDEVCTLFSAVVLSTVAAETASASARGSSGRGSETVLHDMWTSLRTLRRCSSDVVEFANLVEYQRLAVLRMEGPEDVALRLEAAEALKERSDRLGQIADALDCLDVTVFHTLRRLSRPAMLSGIAAWLQEQETIMQDHLKYVFYNRGFHASLAAHVNSGGGSDTMGSRVSTPILAAEPVTPTLASGGGGGSVYHHIPYASLRLADLALFSRCWLLDQSEDVVLDMVQLVRVWFVGGGLPTLLMEVIAEHSMSRDDTEETFHPVTAALRLFVYAFVVTDAPAQRVQWLMQLLNLVRQWIDPTNTARRQQQQGSGDTLLKITVCLQTITAMTRCWVAAVDRQGNDGKEAHASIADIALSVLELHNYWGIYQQSTLPPAEGIYGAYVAHKLETILAAMMTNTTVSKRIFAPLVAAASSSPLGVMSTPRTTATPRSTTSSVEATPTIPSTPRGVLAFPYVKVMLEKLLDPLYHNHEPILVSMLRSWQATCESVVPPTLEDTQDGLPLVTTQELLEAVMHAVLGVVRTACSPDASNHDAIHSNDMRGSRGAVMEALRTLYKFVQRADVSHNGDGEPSQLPPLTAATTGVLVSTVASSHIQPLIVSGLQEMFADLHRGSNGKIRCTAFLANTLHFLVWITTRIVGAPTTAINPPPCKCLVTSIVSTLYMQPHRLHLLMAWLCDVSDGLVPEAPWDASSTVAPMTLGSTTGGGSTRRRSKRGSRVQLILKGLHMLEGYIPASSTISFTDVVTSLITQLVATYDDGCTAWLSSASEQLQLPTSSTAPLFTEQDAVVWLRVVTPAGPPSAVESTDVAQRTATTGVALQAILWSLLQLDKKQLPDLTATVQECHRHLLRDRCSPVLLRNTLEWFALRRSEATHLSSPAWHTMVHHVCRALRSAQRGDSMPRRVAQYDVPRSYAACVVPSPRQFPSPEGFAVSMWVYPQRSQLSPHGTMVLVGFHHSRNRNHKAASAHKPLDALAFQYITTLEVLLQHEARHDPDVLDNDSTASHDGNSQARTALPDMWAPSPHHMSYAAAQDAAAQGMCRVYLRCPDQQFTLGLPNSMIAYDKWTHLAVSGSYEVARKMCHVTVFLNGMEVDCTSITPPRFAFPGFVLVGGGSATSNRNTNDRIIATSNSSDSSHTCPGMSSTPPPPPLDAPFLGLLGPVVLWRSHLTKDDATFLATHPNVDVEVDMPRYSRVRALQGGRIAIQLLAGRMPLSARWLPEGSLCDGRSVPFAGEFVYPDLPDTIDALGGVNATLIPLLLTLPTKSPQPGRGGPLLYRILSALSSSAPLPSSVVGRIGPDASSTAPSDLLPDLLSVVLPCIAKCPVADGLLAMHAIAVVLPSIPDLVHGGIVDPIQDLLRATSIDGGHTQLFRALLHEIVANVALWSTCDVWTRNKLCLVFLEVLRHDPKIIATASATAAETLIPLLLSGVQTVLSMSSSDSQTIRDMRKARILALDTAAALIPTKDMFAAPYSSTRSHGGSTTEVHRTLRIICNSYVSLLQHALDGTTPTQNNNHGEVQHNAYTSPTVASRGRSPFEDTTASSQPYSNASTATTTATHHHYRHSSYVYEVVMAIVHVMRQLSSSGNEEALVAMVEANMQDVLLLAMSRFGDHLHVQRAALVALSSLLRAVPTCTVTLEGRVYQLQRGSMDPFALAPLLNILSPSLQRSRLSAALAIAVIELSEGTQYSLDVPISRGDPLTDVEDKSRRILMRVAAGGDTGTHRGTVALQSVSVLPLLVELLADDSKHDTSNPITEAVLHALCSCVELRVGSAAADAMLNPVTMHSLCEIAARPRPNNEATLDTAASSVVRLLAVSCGRLLSTVPETSWIVMWQVALTMILSSPDHSPIRRHKGITIAQFVAYVANEVRHGWFGSTSVAEEPTATAIPVHRLYTDASPSPQRPISSPTTSTPSASARSATPTSRSKTAVNRMVARLIPLCHFVDLLMVQPYLLLDVVCEDTLGVSTFAACASLMSLIVVHEDSELLQQFLLTPCEDTIAQDAEALPFLEGFRATSSLTLLCRIVRCAIVGLREQSHDRLDEALLSFGIANRSAVTPQQEAFSSQLPSLAVRWTTKAVTQLLLHMCEARRKACTVVFAQDADSVPPCAALLLSELCVALSLNPHTRSAPRFQGTDVCSPLTDGDLKSLCRVVHHGCKLFWDAIAPQLTPSRSTTMFEDWVARSKTDVELCFSTIMRSDAWDTLQKILSVAARRLHEVNRSNTLPEDIIQVVHQGSVRQRSIDITIWSRLTPQRYACPARAATDVIIIRSGSSPIQRSFSNDTLRHVCSSEGVDGTAREEDVTSPSAPSLIVPSMVRRHEGLNSHAEHLYHALSQVLRANFSAWQQWLQHPDAEVAGTSVGAAYMRHRLLCETSWENYCPSIWYVPYDRHHALRSSLRTTPRPASARQLATPRLAMRASRNSSMTAPPQTQPPPASHPPGVASLYQRSVGHVIERYPVELVVGLVAWPAYLDITSEGLLVFYVAGCDQGTEPIEEEDCHEWWCDQELLLGSSPHLADMHGMQPRPTSWHIADVFDCVVAYRLRMRRTALLIRHQCGDGALLNFVDEAAADRAARIIAQQHLLSRSPAGVIAPFQSHRRWSVAGSATPNVAEIARVVQELWVKGCMTNFEYLMRLNALAGRSVHDLSQYPIFPMILADYQSDTLDLNDKNAFRDLRWPISAQTSSQRTKLMDRYKDLQSMRKDATMVGDGELRAHDDEAASNDILMHTSGAAYHNSTLYSSPPSVLHLLVRLEPYTSLHRALHDGRFDLPDRMFTSMARLWEHGSFEALPEMYYLPDMYLSDTRVEGLPNVQLPPWAQGSPWRFVGAMRQALESSYATEHLPHWVDLVFGFRQGQQEAAVERYNTYHPMLDEAWVAAHQDELAHDEHAATLARGAWDNMGQLPMQLFTSPHPSARWAQSHSSQQQQAMRSTVQPLIRRLRVATALISEMAEAPSPSTTPSLQGTSQAASHVVDMMPHPSGTLYFLFTNGVVATTSWKGIPVGQSAVPLGSSAVPPPQEVTQYFEPPMPITDIVPLALLNAATEGTPLEGPQHHSMYVLYGHRYRGTLILASLQSSDESPNLRVTSTLGIPCNPLVVISEDPLPGPDAAVTAAFVVRSFERDLLLHGTHNTDTTLLSATHVGAAAPEEIVATAQSNGVLVLWRSGEANAVSRGLTCMGTMKGHTSPVVAVDVNVLADMVVSVSACRSSHSPNEQPHRAASALSSWRVLLHRLSSKQCLVELSDKRGIAVEGTQAAMPQLCPPSVVVMHAPYAQVVVSTHLGVTCYNAAGMVLFQCEAPDGQPMQRLSLQRVVDMTLVISDAYTSYTFRDWSQSSLENIIAVNFYAKRKDGRSAGMRPVGSNTSPTPSAVSSPNYPTSRVPKFSVTSSANALASNDRPLVAVSKCAVSVDLRGRNHLGPSAIRGIVVLLLSNGTVILVA